MEDRCVRSLMASVIGVVSVVYLMLLLPTLAARIAFPWDVLTCFETPFLVSMMKLENGQPLYNAAEECNCEVYPPGMAMLAWRTLAPLGLATDIRALRSFTTLLTLLFSVFAGYVVARALGSGERQRPLRFMAAGLVGMTGFLLIHRGMTSDQPHPDVLHMLHAVILCLLSLRAIERGGWSWGLAAAAFAGLAVFTKQTAMLAPLAWMVIACGSLRYSWWQAILLSIAGFLSTAGCCWMLGDLRTWQHLYEAMATHMVQWERANQFLDPTSLVWMAPRPALVFMTPWVLWTLARGGDAPRRFLLAWCAIGICEIVPALLGFLKAGGNVNNLAILDLWLFIGVAAGLGCALQPRPSDYLDLEPRRHPMLWAYGLVALALVASLYPCKSRPNHHLARFCHEVQEQVTADVAAGRKVWMLAGASFLVQAGEKDPPRDLGIAVWTIEQGRSPAKATLERIRRCDYDAVYDLFPWHLGVREDIERFYAIQSTVRGAGYWSHEEYRGIQPIGNRCLVYVPRFPHPPQIDTAMRPGPPLK